MQEENKALETFVKIGEMISLRMMLDNGGRETNPMILASMLDGIELYHEKGHA